MDPNDEDSPENIDQKFSIDINAIQSIQHEDQDAELQSLGLSVFDQSVYEKGVLEQVGKALTGDSEHFLNDETNGSSEKEDGQIEEEDGGSKGDGDTLAVPSEGEKPSAGSRSTDALSNIEDYLKRQLKLQTTKRLLGLATPQTSKVLLNRKKKLDKSHKVIVSKTKKIDVRKKPKKTDVRKKPKKTVYLGPSLKKKRKKEKLGTRKGHCSRSSQPGSQPGEENYVYDNTSGSDLPLNSDSEYLPSGSDSSFEFKLKQNKQPKPGLPKKRKRRDYLFYERVDTDDSDWDSGDEVARRKGVKELDDGDPDIYSRRIKEYERTRGVGGVETVEGDLVVPKDIWEKLYDYQKEAVKWFWNLNQNMSGGILGDEMGLGKTIEVIAFLAALHRSCISDHITRYEGLGPTLIVCPTTVMHQWVRELHKWYPPIRVAILHESGTYKGKDRTKIIEIMHRDSSHGIIITSYSGLVQHKESIIPKEWHYVILDEGHKIRNNKAKVTETAKSLDTPYRLILSGSPLQNNLQELWCLFDFICPGKLGTVQVFMESFAVPIMQGGYANASKTQVITAHKCATILKDTITPFLLRRMKEDVGSHINLPEKKEQVLFCRLTDEQRQLYKEYIANIDVQDMVRGRAKIFVALINMRKICNHPDLYSGGPNNNFRISSGDETPNENHFGFWKRAGKMIVIETLLKLWNQQGHRVLLFTQSKKMLLVMEDFVKRQKYKYLKLDGQTSVSARQPLIDKFNKDQSYFLMVLTTKVGGLGVNLTGANRVVIYDPDWNPATDTQARERAWRIGQERDVTVYRLITAGTIEEKIYHRQIFKQFLSNKILKDPKQRRFFKSNDLLELFTLSETVKNGTTETAAIFAGTGSEIAIPKKSGANMINNSTQEVIFSESKIEQMKKLAHLLSRKITETNSQMKTINNNVTSPSTSKEVSTEIYSLYAPDGSINVESALRVISSSSEGNIKTEPAEGSTSPSLPSENSKPDTKSTPAEGSTSASLPSDNSKPDTKSTPVEGSTSASLPSENSKPDTKSRPAEGSTSASLPSDNSKPDTKSITAEKKAHKRKKKRSKEIFAKFDGQEVPHLVKKRKYKHDEQDEHERDYMSQDDYVLKKLFSKGIETAMRHDTIMGGGPSDYAIVEAEAERIAQSALKALTQSQRQTRTSVALPKSYRNKKNDDDANDLLEIIRRRNMLVDASSSEQNLLSSMIAWLSSQGGTSSTDKLIGEFRYKVGDGKTPLFKALLEKIATFFRGPDKIGYWTIKDEYASPSTSRGLGNH